jgi:Protein of unknown function (DUF998)
MPHRPGRPSAAPFALWLALGLSLFGGLVLAAHFYPRPYDWRRDVMSSLASPRDNPQAYGIACAGLALGGIFLAPFAVLLRQRLAYFAPATTRWAGRLLILGAVFLTLAALIVPGHYRILGIGRTHEHLAQIAGVALVVSMILYVRAALALPRPFALQRLVGLLLVAVPVTALVVSRLSLLAAGAFASPTVYRAIRSSLWNSLALWEWIGAIGIYLFLAMITFGLPKHPPE